MSWSTTIPSRTLSGVGEICAWNYGVVVTKVLLKQDTEGWLVVVNATKGSKRLVAFTGGRTFADAVEAFLWEVNEAQLNWKDDKFAK